MNGSHNSYPLIQTEKAIVKTFEEIKDILAKIDYKSWRFVLSADDCGCLNLQVEFWDVDSAKTLKGRKWRISKHMCTTEIVSTAFKAVLAAEEHEAREKFQYFGSRVFGPHIDINSLMLVSEELDVREPLVDWKSLNKEQYKKGLPENLLSEEGYPLNVR